MERLVNRIYHVMERGGYANADDRDVLEYGLELLIDTIVSSAVIILLGWILGYFWISFILLNCFSVLQSICGGYHAKTHLRCFFVTLAGWGVGMALVLYSPVWIMGVLTILSIPVNLYIAPLENVNAPMSQQKKARMRIIGRSICVVFSLIGFVLLMLGIDLGKAILCSVVMSGVSLIAGRALNQESD